MEENNKKLISFDQSRKLSEIGNYKDNEHLGRSQTILKTLDNVFLTPLKKSSILPNT